MRRRILARRITLRWTGAAGACFRIKLGAAKVE